MPHTVVEKLKGAWNAHLPTSVEPDEQTVAELMRRHDRLMYLADEYAAERRRQQEGLPSPKRAAFYDALESALRAAFAKRSECKDADMWHARALALFWNGNADDVTAGKIREATALIDAALAAKEQG